MQNGGVGLPSIILADKCLLLKMLITIEPHGIFYHILHSNTFWHYQQTGGMQNGDLAFPKYFLWQSLVTILHTCISILLKCIGTLFRAVRAYFRPAMLKHSVNSQVHNFQKLKYKSLKAVNVFSNKNKSNLFEWNCLFSSSYSGVTAIFTAM